METSTLDIFQQLLIVIKLLVNANATAISNAMSTCRKFNWFCFWSCNFIWFCSKWFRCISWNCKAVKAYNKAASVETALANYQEKVGKTYLPLSGGTITGNLAVKGTSNLVGATTVGGALTVNNNGTITGNIVLNTNENNTTTIKGKTSMASTLDVAKTANFNQNVNIKINWCWQDITTGDS